LPDRRCDDDYDPDRWDAHLIEWRDGPRELEDGVHRRTTASLNNGWFARGGRLAMHDDHLSFTPTPIERLLFGRDLRIDFSEIIRVERHPERPKDVLPGGQSPRMRLITGSKSFDFLFMSGLDDWISAVEDRLRIWENRRRFV
jgi:hypothetical protein